MSSGYKRTVELLGQLIGSKKNLADTLVEKGEEADFNEPFDDLVEKAANYVPKTYIFVDEEGNEVAGTLVEQETVLTATTNDVREGKVFVSETGLKTGEKFIPSYVITEGYRIITNGSVFAIPLAELNKYDFTKLQVIVCPWGGSLVGSVAAEKVGIDENVYAANSTEIISPITRDNENKKIDLGITNNSGSLYVLRYFTYKEIY